MTANPKLVEERQIDEADVRMINMWHEVVDTCVEEMDQNDADSDRFKLALVNWRKANKNLQKLWKFELDESKYYEWHLPKCKCPLLDNNEMGAHVYINCSCPIHGDESVFEERKNK